MEKMKKEVIVCVKLWVEVCLLSEYLMNCDVVVDVSEV